MLPSNLLVISAMLIGTRAQGSEVASISAEIAAATSSVAAGKESSLTTLATSATATSSSAATTHTVNVGASGHKFTPNQVEAEVGDIIEWRFYPDGHWVIRGDFDNPCIPYEYVDTDRRGFSSGPEAVKAITDDGPRYRVRVNDTDPIFFYCGAPGSCVEYHMMGVVNPSKNETLDEWLKKAEDVDYQLRPGDPFPTETDSSHATGSATADPSSSSDSKDDDKGGSGLGTGAIAGIAVGGAAVLVIAGGLLYLCGRRGGFDKAYRKSFRGSTAPQYPVNSPGMTEAAQYVSPQPTATEAWNGHKQPSPMSIPYGQSPPMSPQHTPNYGYHQMTPHHDGTMSSYYSDQPSQHMTPPPPHHEQVQQNPLVVVPPAELPTSADPGNSPLPGYSNDGQPRAFSWAGEETAYRPGK